MAGCWGRCAPDQGLRKRERLEHGAQLPAPTVSVPAWQARPARRVGGETGGASLGYPVFVHEHVPGTCTNTSQETVW